MILPPLRRVILTAIAAAAILGFGICYYYEAERIQQYSAAIKERQVVLQQKEDSVRNYQEMVDFYGTDEGIEHIAREQYNLSKSGDRVILLQQD